MKRCDLLKGIGLNAVGLAAPGGIGFKVFIGDTLLSPGGVDRKSSRSE